MQILVSNKVQEENYIWFFEVFPLRAPKQPQTKKGFLKKGCQFNLNRIEAEKEHTFANT